MLDHAALGDEAMDQFEFESMQSSVSVSSFIGKDQHKGLCATVGTGDGVGSGKGKKDSKKNRSDDGEGKQSKKTSARGGGGFGGPK